MTKRATDVIGKPVVSAVTGQRMGTVADLLLDDEGVALVGIVIHRGWMKRENVLPVSSLQTIGSDAVLGRTSEVVTPKEWRERRAINDHR